VHKIKSGSALKGHAFPKTLFFMRFSFMSGMAFRIATLKRAWKKEGLMLIMLRSIVGLSVMRQPLQQKLPLRNETQIDL
jgi:hypothetical protein